MARTGGNARVRGTGSGRMQGGVMREDLPEGWNHRERAEVRYVYEGVAAEMT